MKFVALLYAFFLLFLGLLFAYLIIYLTIKGGFSDKRL